jgi:putative sterol carrier protein
MADATAEFFGELGRRGHEPLLNKVTATVRFDLVQGRKTDRWFVTIKQGDIMASRRSAKADCTIRTSKAVFDRMARGEENLMAATLRGDIDVEGNVTLLVLFRRLFPGPPGSRRRRSKAKARSKK